MEDGEIVTQEPSRPVAPGGVKRLVIGFACGLAAGALIGLVLPRDDLPRRQTLRLEPAPGSAPGRD